MRNSDFQILLLFFFLIQDESLDPLNLHFIMVEEFLINI